jgi:membrane-associated protease RseP (regulator of RpoE activity)
MNGIWYYVIAFIVIWLVALLFKEKLVNYGVEVSFPTLMWKTTRLRGFIDRLANISPRFWRWFMNVGLVVSFIGMGVMVYLLVISLSTVTQAPAVSLIIPGVEVPGSPIFIPFIYGFLALATVIIVHEFSHGILARVEKISIKSIGLLLFTILPGAFVEPDEDEMKNTKKSSRMRIFAAGSIANMSLGLIAFLILFVITGSIMPGIYQEDGMVIDRIVEDSPANNILKQGMIIKAINGENVHDSNSYLTVVSKLKPNEKANILTDQGNHVLKTGSNPNNASRGYMGIQIAKNFKIKDNIANTWGNQLPWIWFYLEDLFFWIFILNISVGLFNLLPIRLLDGGHLFEDLLSSKLPEKIVKPTTRIVSYFLIIIIVFYIAYGLIMGVS